MFEYHAWATVQSSVDDESVDDTQRHAAVGRVREELKRLDGHPGLVDLRGQNGLDYVHISGFRNHWQPEVVDVFRRIGQVAPGSYGMFYFWDDEDPQGRRNEFQVLVMRRGEVTEETDPFLSPCVPMIEDES